MFFEKILNELLQMSENVQTHFVDLWPEGSDLFVVLSLLVVWGDPTLDDSDDTLAIGR